MLKMEMTVVKVMTVSESGNSDDQSMMTVVKVIAVVKVIDSGESDQQWKVTDSSSSPSTPTDSSSSPLDTN